MSSGLQSVTLSELSVTAGSREAAVPSVANAFIDRPRATFQDSVNLLNAQQALRQTPPLFSPNQDSIAATRERLDRSAEMMAEMRANRDRVETPAERLPSLGAGTQQTSDSFASATIPAQPVLPPAAGPSFDPNGPAAPLDFKGMSEEAQPEGSAEQVASTAPAEAAGTNPFVDAGSSLTRGAAGAFDKAVAAATDSAAGRLAARAIPAVGTALQILESTPAVAPDIAPELAASPTSRDGNPRLLYAGSPVLDPAPLAKQAGSLTPPALGDAFTVPPPPETLTPPAALTPVPGAAAAPLPGFTPAPTLPVNEGLTPSLPKGFGPLPGLATAPPQDVNLPGLRPAEQTPPLPGLVPADPGLLGPQVVLNEALGLTPQERSVVNEALIVYASPEFQRILAAQQAGMPVEVEIAGRTIQYEPGLPSTISGMTLTSYGIDGFVIRPGAFASPEELDKTLLQELYRVGTGQSAEGVGQDAITAQTDDARGFADRALEVFRNGR